MIVPLPLQLAQRFFFILILRCSVRGQKAHTLYRFHSESPSAASGGSGLHSSLGIKQMWGGLAQRVRAKRGPMTGPGVIHCLSPIEMADYAFRLRASADSNPPKLATRAQEGRSSALRWLRRTGRIASSGSIVHCALNAEMDSSTVRAIATASVPIPKFASLCGTLLCELRNRKDTSNVLI